MCFIIYYRIIELRETQVRVSKIEYPKTRISFLNKGLVPS